jgi:PAS domain S-box-containing protein
MKSNRVPTISSRLALLVIACVIPASLMVVVLISYDYQRERARLVRDSIATAHAMVLAVDRELSSVALAAEILGTSPDLQRGDIYTFYAYAQSVVPRYKGNNVVLSDATGQQLINTIRPLGAQLPRHGNPEQLRKVFEMGRPVISDVYIGGVLKRPIISIDVPVWRDGKVTYDLSVGLFPEHFVKLLIEERLPPSWLAAIFDSTGTIVSRTHAMDRFVGQKGSPALVKRMKEVPEDSFEGATLEGIPVLTVFSRSTISHWTVAVGIPMQELTSELRRLLWWLIPGVALLLLSSLAVAGAIGGRISRSIHGLSSPALALGLGEAVTVPPLRLKEADEVGQALMKASKMLQEAQQRIRATVESAPTAMVMIDAAGTIVLANAETERLFSYGHDELLRQQVEVLIPDRFRSKHSGLRTDYFASPVARAMGAGRDLYARRKDGTEFPVEIGLSPVRTDEELFVLAAIVDITERMRQTEALRKSNEALERSNIELQRFAYVASHDLQTPMRTVASFVELLQSTYGDKLDAQANDWIRRTVEAIKHLQTLIRDLLEYSRIDSQARRFERVPLREVFDHAVSLLDASVREAGAEVSCGELPVVMGDRSQLVQLMLNLIDNGIKYRGTDPPRIHVSAERTGNEWTVAVRDNGIGIVPRYHERIFELFKRLHNQREYPGTGIGLAVCRRVVQRHGGKIWVESESGRGSVFYFTIAEGTVNAP